MTRKFTKFARKTTALLTSLILAANMVIVDTFADEQPYAESTEPAAAEESAAVSERSNIRYDVDAEAVKAKYNALVQAEEKRELSFTADDLARFMAEPTAAAEPDKAAVPDRLQTQLPDELRSLIESVPDRSELTSSPLIDPASIYPTASETEEDVASEAPKTGSSVNRAAAAVARRIIVSALPTKTSYYIGEELDLTGGKIQVEYSDRTFSDEIPMTAENVTVTGFRSDKAAVVRLTVKYLGKTTYFNAEICLDPAKAPVVMNNKGYATLTAALKACTENITYIIDVKTDVTENNLTVPRTALEVGIFSSTGSVIHTNSITANADLGLYCVVSPSGTKDPDLKVAAGKTAALGTDNYFGKISGTKTSTLYLKEDVCAVAQNVENFGVVYIYNRVLVVAGKFSGVGDLTGSVWMTNETSAAAFTVTNTHNTELVLTASVKDKSGNYKVPKVTVTDVADGTLGIGLIGADNSQLIIPEGQPVAYAGGKTDFGSRIVIYNETEQHSDMSKIRAFLYNKEYRAEYAEALTLITDNDQISGFYPTFELLFNAITNDTANNTESDTIYSAVLNEDCAPDAFKLPTKAGEGIVFYGSTGAETLTLPGITTLSSKYSLGFEGMTIRNINPKTGKDVMLTVSVGANSDLAFTNVTSMYIKELKGTKTSELYVDGSLITQNINTFAAVCVEKEALVGVEGKISGVSGLWGDFLMLGVNSGSSVTVDTVGSATFYIIAKTINKNGSYNLPKITVKSITESLDLIIYDDDLNAVTLPDGQPVLYNGGNNVFGKKVTVLNPTVSSDDPADCGVFLYNKEYRYEYAKAVLLECDNPDLTRFYPGLAQALDEIGKDTQYNGDSDSFYDILLYEDISLDKLTLPAKAGGGLFIYGEGYTLTLPGITTISPKYNFVLVRMYIENINKRNGANVPLTVSCPDTVMICDTKFYGSVKADELIINEAEGSEYDAVFTGIDVNTIRTYSKDYFGRTMIKLVSGGQYKVKQHVKPYSGEYVMNSDDARMNYGDLTLTFIDKTGAETVFPEGRQTVLFSAFNDIDSRFTTGAEFFNVTNNGGLVPFVNNGKLVVEPPSSGIVPSDVTYRALLIGEENYREDENFVCERCMRNRSDVGLMTDMLAHVRGAEGGKYRITTGFDMNEQTILDAISDTFADADDNDVSLFFIATHGEDTRDDDLAGALLMSDGSPLKLATLANALAQVNGKVIVLIQSCGSGAAVYANSADGLTRNSAKADPDRFNELVIKAFAEADTYVPDGLAANRGEFRVNKFYVLTASSYHEVSYGYESYGNHFNFFTFFVTTGVFLSKQDTSWNFDADSNKNGTISMDEVFAYVQIYQEAWEPKQYAMMYPENSTYPLFKK